MKKIENIKNAEQSPVFKTDYKGVQVTITFTETVGEKNVKQIITDMLTKSYERRVTG